MTSLPPELLAALAKSQSAFVRGFIDDERASETRDNERREVSIRVRARLHR